MSRPSTLVVLLLGLVSATHGHIGGKSFAVYELPDEGLEEVDLHDGSIGEWEALLGAPSLRARPDWVASAGHYVTAITEVPYGVVDGDWRVWLAWNRSTSRVYFAMERRDDVHIGSDAGEGIQDAWQGDSISLMIDGDHSGGEYAFSPHIDSGVCCEADEEYKLANNSQAQQYWAIAEPPRVGYLGAGAEWVNRPPYSEAGGMVAGNTSVLEFYVTVFDSLVWDSPDRSVRSVFSAGMVIGFELEVLDYDEPVESPLVLQIAKQANPWRFAERFVDGVLLPSGTPQTVVVDSTWGGLKAGFRP